MNGENTIALDPKDLRISDYVPARHLSGFGKNPRYGVTLFHVPTGIEVNEDAADNVHTNKHQAIVKLELLVHAEMLRRQFKPVEENEATKALNRLRQYLNKASFSSNVDKHAAFECVKTIEQYLKG